MKAQPLNVRVEVEFDGRAAILFEVGDARFHRWAHIEGDTITFADDILHRNSIAAPSTPGHFKHRALQASAKANAPLLDAVMRAIVEGNLIAVGRQKLQEQRDAEIAEHERYMAAQRVQEAAPDLYAALQGLLAAHPLPDDLRRVPDSVIAAHDAARDAIAKAEGRS